MAKRLAPIEPHGADSIPAMLERVTLRRIDRSGAALDPILGLAVETPVALVYNGISHAVMMASPNDLEDFALGFTLSEGIAETPREIGEIEIRPRAAGIEIAIELAQSAFWRLKERRRNLAGRTGCGLCGIEALDMALPALPRLDSEWRLPLSALHRAIDDLPQWQRANRETHSLHAAAFADREGRIAMAREDVGRHNALDKLIGALAAVKISPATGFLLITSRCSVEMASKAILSRAPILVAVSAPTALARDLAEAHNLTLVALARRDSFLIAAHGERILSAPIPPE